MLSCHRDYKTRMRRVIGLDFGSSQSLVAVMEIGTNQSPEILKIDELNEISRTLLALDKNDDHIVAAGNKVWDMMKERGGKDFYIVRNFKRYLGDTMPPDVDENVAGVSADKFCEEFLRHLSEKIRKHFNVESLSKDDFSTCIAHPATWDEKKVQLLVKIVKEVGFPDVHAIAEPLAAVYAVKNQREESFADKTENYLVVDFGGGTLDVCVIEMGILGRFAKIVSRSGNPRLGGHEFDNIVQTQYFRNANLKESALNPRQKAYIREECEREKRRISVNMAKGASEVICMFDTPSLSQLPVTRDDIVNWSRDADILEQYKQCIEEALGDGGLDISMISKVILTGGTSQWWFLKDVFTSSENGGYGIDEDKVIITNHPHTDVCIGCAIHAGYAENRELIPGIWVKYRVGKYKNENEGWTELQQLRAPALPGRQAASEQKFLTLLTKSKQLSSYRIEFKWFSGISESNLAPVNEDTGIVEFYARSNKGFLSPITDKVKRVMEKIIESDGSKIQKPNDSYKIYIQMSQTNVDIHYKLLILDAKEQARDKARANKGDAPADELPAGKRTECEVKPGYISKCSFLGIFSRTLREK